MQKQPKVDRSKVNRPKVEVSSLAWDQLKLIKKMDYTLEEKHLRVAIKGKECDGFTYEVYFDQKKEDDFIIKSNNHLGPMIVMDPFSAFYLNDSKISYVLNPEDDSEGFCIENLNQSVQHGKFWVKKGAKTPPLL